MTKDKEYEDAGISSTANNDVDASTEKPIITTFRGTTLAVYVHKHYTDRVEAFLLKPLHHQIPWKTMLHQRNRASSIESSTTDTAVSSAGNPAQETSTTEAATIATAKPATSATPKTISGDNTTDKNDSHAQKKMSVMDTTETSGMSHERRGHLVALMEDIARPIHTMSAMARQNICWVMKLTHETIIASSNLTTPGSIPMEEIAQQIFGTLPVNAIPLVDSNDNNNDNNNKQSLRVDVYPKKYTDGICLGLQHAFYDSKTKSQSLEEANARPEVPYEGPISMTRSASKCSHRLSIIVTVSSITASHDDGDIQNDKTADPPSKSKTLRVCWGWADRSEPDDKNIMELRCNEFGAQDISNVSPDHVTGGEIGGKVVPSETPLSRAYYKLDQVFEEILERPDSYEAKVLQTIQKLEASAADLGSAPGGWTQVLAKHVKKGTICSVDKGTLADRAAKLPRVHYIRSLMEDCQAAIEPFGPFGIVVSDASLLWSEMLDMMSTSVTNHSSISNGSSSNNNNNNGQAGDSPIPDGNDDNNIEPALKKIKVEIPGPKFTLPCLFVLTMKLPFRTYCSVHRHIQGLEEQLPKYLSTMAAAMYPPARNGDSPEIQTRHTIAHLMANSSSERTLIIIFDRAPIHHKGEKPIS